MKTRANIIEISATSAEIERYRAEVLFTRQQVADRHQATVETVKRREKQGIYKPCKIGRTIRFKLSDLVALEKTI
jgi:hypothetical protein